MSMESAAWSTLYRTMSAQTEQRPFSRVTVRRIEPPSGPCLAHQYPRRLEPAGEPVVQRP